MEEAHIGEILKHVEPEYIAVVAALSHPGAEPETLPCAKYFEGTIRFQSVGRHEGRYILMRDDNPMPLLCTPSELAHYHTTGKYVNCRSHR